MSPQAAGHAHDDAAAPSDQQPAPAPISPRTPLAPHKRSPAADDAAARLLAPAGDEEAGDGFAEGPARYRALAPDQLNPNILKTQASAVSGRFVLGCCVLVA